MYLDYFELAEMPFSILADPRFLWYSTQHREVKAKIIYQIQQGRGPIYLFADFGLGKTSLARRIFDELGEDKTKRVVFANPPKLRTPNAFLRFIMDEFEVKTDKNYARSLARFEQFLVEQHQARIAPVLLIDEGQNMTRGMLELIHHFFNFSTRQEFLIHIALFGQNELGDLIASFPSLQSRMIPARLKPFTPAEVEEMIAFRWRVAGGSEHPPFQGEAVQEIYELTQGNPRDICKLCDASLLIAYAQEKKSIDRDLVIASAVEVFVRNKKE